MHQEGACDVQWSDQIWKECEDSLQQSNPGLSKQQVEVVYRDIRKALGRHPADAAQTNPNWENDGVNDLSGINIAVTFSRASGSNTGCPNRVLEI